MTRLSASVGPTRPQHAWCRLVCGMILAGAAPHVCQADDEAVAGRVSVVTVTGDVVDGRLQSLQQSLTIESDEGQSRTFVREDLISLRYADAEVSISDPMSLALLVNGDVLAGRPVGVGDDQLNLAWTGTDPPTMLQVPLEFVRAIVLALPEAANERRQLQRQWGLPRSGTDRLLLRNRTSVDGELSGLDGRNVLLETGLGPVSTPRDDVLALTLNAELAARMPLQDVSSILLCTDGSRITLHGLTIDSSGILTATAAAGGEISLPLEQVEHLEFYGPRVQSLAAREPAEYTFTPFLTQSHPLVTQRNVHGGPLRLRGTRYAAGIGVSSRSEVSWELGDEGWQKFAATIGLDDAADGGGHVVFRMVVDGETVYDSGDVGGTTKPIAVGPLDVSGARRLTLSVDFGRAGDIHDIADWCDPLLLR